jgi:hypothetical protein
MARENKIVKIIREKGPIDTITLAEALAKVSPNSRQAREYLESLKRDLPISSRYNTFWLENLYAHLSPLRQKGIISREKIGKRWVYSV